MWSGVSKLPESIVYYGASEYAKATGKYLILVQASKCLTSSEL